jgi:hypothetical protein
MSSKKLKIPPCSEARTRLDPATTPPMPRITPAIRGPTTR